MALDFHPDTPIRLLGLEPTVPELPIIPSDMDELKSTVQQAMAELRKLPLEAILNDVMVTLTRINTLLEGLQLKRRSLAGGRHADARQLLAHAETEVGPGAKLEGLAEVASRASETLRADAAGRPEALARRGWQAAPLAGGAKETLTSARETPLVPGTPWAGAGPWHADRRRDARAEQADRTFLGTAASTGPYSATLPGAAADPEGDRGGGLADWWARAHVERIPERSTAAKPSSSSYRMLPRWLCRCVAVAPRAATRPGSAAAWAPRPRRSSPCSRALTLSPRYRSRQRRRASADLNPRARPRDAALPHPGPTEPW